MTRPNHRGGSGGYGSTSLLLSAFLRIEEHCGKLTAVAVSIALSVPAHLAGQTFQGSALDRVTNAPVATTLVLLISEDGNLRGSSIANASGFYSIDVPGPGIYRLEGQMLGYENFLTPPIEVRNPEGVHPVDLLLRTSPLSVESLVVSAELPVRSSIDLSPSALRYKPIQFEDIQYHIGRGRDLSDALRRPIPGRLIAFNTTEGPCLSLRSLNCLPVTPNGMHPSPDFPTDGLDGPYEEYYENGQLKAKGTIRDGEVEGRWEEYYENGRLMTKGTIKDGEPDGPYEHYDENGQLQTKGTMKDGEVEGRWEEYYENGRLMTKGTIKDGEPDGPYEHYDENGQLQTKGTMKDGEVEGPWEEYYENGQLMTKRTYRAGGYDGPYERYDENGQLQLKSTYKDGVVDGWTEEYYENGRLKTKGTYKDGYLDGPWEEYYENGRLKTRGTYKDGNRTGGWEEYYENGQLRMKRTYNGEF